MKVDNHILKKFHIWWDESWITYPPVVFGGIYCLTYSIRVYYKIPLGDDISTGLWAFFFGFFLLKLGKPLRKKKKSNSKTPPKKKNTKSIK